MPILLLLREEKGFTQEQCYYLRPKKPKTEDECDGCPYGTYGPRVVSCHYVDSVGFADAPIPK